MMAVTPQAQAASELCIGEHAVAKLRDAAVLAAPPSRTGIYAHSLETAASVLFTTIAAGDIAVHLGKFGPDQNHHYGRAFAGWHQEKSLALPAAQRRDCWRGAWNDMSLGTGLSFVGHTAIATVSGFIVDVASVTGASLCPCCPYVVLDLQTPSPEAAARYRGRRVTVPPRGKKWTSGPPTTVSDPRT
ncbi:MAG: hypothetical protein QOJ73_2441 [Streptosporangiaceae bacterium]|jgi:hypothetical protein|nr:hypothetical protein [Streptosporangiaceae bacterium]